MNDITKNTVENFSKKGFKAKYFEAPNEALEYIKSEIGSEELGISGSVTVKELGWYDALCQRGKTYWHGATPEIADIRQKANASPNYMASANAISQTGEIVNIDGVGNRVAACSFGAKKVFFVCGENKIVPSLADAIFRAKNVAAPLNAKRLNCKTPCAIKADKCYDCRSPERICRVTSIITFPILKMETHVLFIKGSWGY